MPEPSSFTAHAAPLLVCGLGLIACGGEPEPRTEPFLHLVEQVDRVVLEEPDTAPLTGIKNFAPTGDGRYLVVDEGRPQARLFGGDGSLLGIIGQHGSGPGEFRNPTAARMDTDGRLYVADSDGGVLTRFDAGMAYDTAIKLPGLLAYQIDFFGEDQAQLFTVLWNEPSKPHDFLAALLTPGGALVKGLHPVDSLIWTVPYWSSFAGPIGAAGTDRIVTENMFFYPLHLYGNSGVHIRDFGFPPQSWRPAGRPERGAFIGAGGLDRLSEWLHAMTVIRSVGIYRDSAIIVVHANPNPGVTKFWSKRDTLLDIYTMDGAKVWEDVPVPARVLRIEDHLYLLEGQPPEPWTVGVYRLRRPPAQ